MTDSLLKLVNALLNEDSSEFREAFDCALEERKSALIENRKDILSSSLMEKPKEEEEEEDEEKKEEPKDSEEKDSEEETEEKPEESEGATEAKPEKTEDDAEIALDPGMEKEFFMKAFEEGGRRVTLKTLGTGQTAPVIVYVDEKRWEVFSGPKMAEKAVKEYIGTLEKETENEVSVTKEEYFYEVIKRGLDEHNFKYTSISGEKLYMTKENAKLISELHDILSPENQRLLRERVIINKDGLNGVIKFARRTGLKQ